MRGIESQRVFVIGESVVMPYQSKGLVLHPDTLTHIVFDSKESLIGVLPTDRRDTSKPDGGALLGSFFPNKYISPASFRDEFTKIIPRLGWRIPKGTHIKSPGEMLSVATCLKALENAGITPDSFDDKRPWIPKGESQGSPLMVAVGFTNSLGPVELIINAVREGFTDQNNMSLSRGGLSGHTNVAVIDAINSQGPSILHQAGCSTSFFNLHDANRKLRHGEADMALVGGFELSSEWIYMFAAMKALASFPQFKDDPGSASRPLDRTAAQLVFSEGAAGLVLATEETMNRLHIPQEQALAEILGSATGQDPSRLVPPEKPRELGRVLHAALNDAGIEPSDLQETIYHSTGTVSGEKHDWLAAREMAGLPMRKFEDEPDNPYPGLPYSVAPKSYTGHTFGASGALSTLTLFDSFKRDEIPGTRNLEHPHGLVFNASSENMKVPDMRQGLIATYGMDGTASAVVFKKTK